MRGVMTDRWSTSLHFLFLQQTPFSLPPPLLLRSCVTNGEVSNAHPKTHTAGSGRCRRDGAV